MVDRVIFVSDLPNDPDNPTGPTVREANMKLEHKIPIDSLVEVKYETWFGEGACIKAHARLWVVDHTRDCDGTPLYSLANFTSYTLKKDFEIDFHSAYYQLKLNAACHVFETGFNEERLTVIERTPKLDEGYGALTWERDDDGKIVS